MKTPIMILLLSLSFNALAQVEHPCTEFDQKRTAIDMQVKDFDREMRKIDAKLRNIEERLAVRTQALNALLAQRESLNASIRQLSDDQIRLRQEINRLQVESSRLNTQIAQLDQQRQYHVSQARVTSGNVQREHLRNSKRLEKDIEQLQATQMANNQTLAANTQQISRIDMQVQQQSQQIASVNAQIDQEQRDPAVIRLQQDRTQAQNELSNAQITLDNLSDKLARATAHVDMCYGYIELSVKYPTALRVSKKLVKQGCARYIPEQNGSELELQAQDEVLNTACRP